MFTLTRKIFRINNTSDPSGAAIRPPQHRVPTLLVSLSMLLLLMAFPGYTQTYATAGVFDLEITTGGAMVITATGADGGNALNSGNTGGTGGNILNILVALVGNETRLSWSLSISTGTTVTGEFQGIFRTI
jgi:hypothetical protein